jgi:hypothetical protein
MYEPICKLFLNNCGRLNLKTGRNLHFNVIADWDGSESLVVIWRRDGKFQVVGTCGSMRVGKDVELYTNTHRYLRQGTIGKSFPNTDEGRAALRAEYGNSVPFSTLD